MADMQNILDAIVNAGGRPMFVGGCVRDELMGVASKDIDVEVYGLSPDSLVAVLRKFGRVDCVGESFAVIKLTTKDDDFDFSMPRRDNKVGDGHKGFVVEVDHSMTVEEALLRRDYTINAMAKGLDGTLVDPYGGRHDLHDGVLRATSKHFVEDPLRVLRGFQFASRFDMAVEPNTAHMCQELLTEAHTISPERVYMEMMKWCLKSTVPSKGLYFLRATGWTKLFPELHALVDLPQDPEWHPEGDAFVHTALVCDAARDIAVRDRLNDEDRVVLMLAALCHDLGKAKTTVMRDGRWRSPGHAEEGVDLTKSLLARMGFCDDASKKTKKGKSILDKVVPLVRDHMSHIGMEPNDRSVRRMAARVAPSNIGMLVKLMEADHSGRPPLEKCVPVNASKILLISQRLDLMNNKPEPIVKGRHLIDMGLDPGPEFKQILDKCYQAQLDGLFNDLESGLALV